MMIKILLLIIALSLSMRIQVHKSFKKAQRLSGMQLCVECLCSFGQETLFPLSRRAPNLD